VIAGRVRAFDVTKFTLETEIDDFADILGLEFFGVDFGVFALGAILVDGVEHGGKAAAVFDAHPAIGAQTEDPLDFRPQVFWVVVALIGRIISGIVGHGHTPVSEQITFCHFSARIGWKQL
jgi:hypothetical protein